MNSTGKQVGRALKAVVFLGGGAYHPFRWWRENEGEPEGCCCEENPGLYLPEGYKAAVCLAGPKAAAAAAAATVWPPEKTHHEPWWSVAGTMPGRRGMTQPSHFHSADWPAQRPQASARRKSGAKRKVTYMTQKTQANSYLVLTYG